MEYLAFLKEFVGTSIDEQENSHVIMTTHNPLAIAELERGQVQILQSHEVSGRRMIVASFPDMDPRGMGYASIVTSKMFGIASSLDRSTQLDLEKQRLLATRDELNAAEKTELDTVNERLDGLGFRFFYPDDEYSRYLRHRREVLEQEYSTSDHEIIASKVINMSLEDREALSRRLVANLVKHQKVRVN